MSNTAISYSLKPCPFCGSKPKDVQQIYENGGMDGSYKNWIIRCSGCSIYMEYAADGFYGRDYDPTPKTIVDMWNRRISDANRDQTRTESE